MVSRTEMREVRQSLEELREDLIEGRLEGSSVEVIVEKVSVLRDSDREGRFAGNLEAIQIMLGGIQSNLKAMRRLHSAYG